MITDKQFNDSFTTAGGWFILTQFEAIYNWQGTKSDLVAEMYSRGFDKKEQNTNSRVSSVLRIIQEDRGEEALVKIRDSKNINKQHPDAYDLANELLEKYYFKSKV